MARETGTGNRSVIDIHRLPAGRYMAVAASIGSLWMISGLAGSGCAIMTGLTGAGNGKMIDTLGWNPATGCVAILTAVGGGNMCCRFTRGGGAVVTRETGAGNGGMIDIHCLPVAGHMAVSTSIGSLRMVGRLARSRSAVMTGLAGAGDGIMVHLGNSGPGRWHMATLTAIGCGNMGC